jgi:choline dehydrogenase-like flavoprotein
LAFWDILSTSPNFKAVTFAVVEKILFQTPSGAQEPVAYGVEYSVTVNGVKSTQTAYADKEVILSAGTLQTPQVLMLSVCAFFPLAPIMADDFLGNWTAANVGKSPNPGSI